MSTRSALIPLQAVIGIAAGLVLGPAGVTETGAATRTSAFAPIDPGVRASAMGGAYSALGGEPTALYWNPATLYYQKGRSLEASYADLYGLGLARRTFLTLGLKTTIEEPRFEGDRVVVTHDRESGLAYALGVQSLFLDLEDQGYSELSVGGAAGWGYGDRLAVGVAFRTLFVSSDFDEVSAFGYNLGFGATWRYSARERIAISIPQLVSRLFWKFDSTERLPLNVAVGWARTWDPGITVSGEAEWREGENGPYRLALGGEWWAARDRLALRAGFRHLSGDLSNVNKPSFGAGVLFGRLRFDYAFRLETDALGDTHRLGLLVGF